MCVYSFWGEIEFEQNLDGCGYRVQKRSWKREHPESRPCEQWCGVEKVWGFFEGWRDHLKEGNGFCWIFLDRLVDTGLLKVFNIYWKSCIILVKGLGRLYQYFEEENVFNRMFFFLKKSTNNRSQVLLIFFGFLSIPPRLQFANVESVNVSDMIKTVV